MQLAQFHREFSLNGNSFETQHELLSFVKKNTPASYEFLVNWFNNEEYVRVPTSGSTGGPKRIRLKKAHMINSARATGQFFELPQKTTALMCLSPAYIAGKMMWIRALTLGWQLEVVAPAKNPLEDLEKTFDFSAMVPLQVYHSLDHLIRIKKLIIGGGVLSEVLEKQLHHINCDVYATFGMTETITHIAARSVAKKHHTAKRKYYRTLPGIHISQDARGCLCIEAPNISDKIVGTNDLVRLISPTEFEWLGRFDTVINSGGIKLIPEQIEAKLSNFLAMRFFVAGVPDAVLGEKLVLIVEAEAINDGLLSSLKAIKSLSNYELPKAVFNIDNFVETETKKIQRRQTLDLIFR